MIIPADRTNRPVCVIFLPTVLAGVRRQLTNIVAPPRFLVIFYSSVRVVFKGFLYLCAYRNKQESNEIFITNFLSLNPL